MLGLLSEQGTPLWSAVRSSPDFVNASVLGQYFNQDPYRPKSLLTRATRESDYNALFDGSPREKPSYPAQRGIFYEPTAVQHFVKRFVDTRKWALTEPCGVCAHTDLPLMASPDALFYSRAQCSQMFGLEVKVPMNPEKTMVSGVPTRYFLQLQGLMMCFRLDRWLLYVYDADAPQRSQVWAVHEAPGTQGHIVAELRKPNVFGPMRDAPGSVLTIDQDRREYCKKMR